MKHVLVLLVFLVCSLISVSAFARCLSGDVWAAPKSDAVLPANGSVIVTLFGTEATAYTEKRKKKKIFFKSGKHKVEAKLIKIWESDFRLRALHFKATKNLKIGKIYSLRVNGKRFKWKVGKVDSTSPKWVTSPTQKEFKNVEYGCGPAVNFVLNLKVTDNSAVFYEVQMKSKNRKSQFFFVTATGMESRIGHGMCYGEFVPPQGQDVQVEMTPYDFAGNRGDTKSVTLSSK